MISSHSNEEHNLQRFPGSTPGARGVGVVPFSPPLVFVVDDDEAVRGSVSLLLRSFGWKARAFASAGDLLEALAVDWPDCLMLDLDMPGMNGADLLEKLNRDRVQVPVVVVTGDEESRLARRAEAAGARAILAKPFDDVELKTLIERAIM